MSLLSRFSTECEQYIIRFCVDQEKKIPTRHFLKVEKLAGEYDEEGLVFEIPREQEARKCGANHIRRCCLFALRFYFVANAVWNIPRTFFVCFSNHFFTRKSSAASAPIPSAIILKDF